MLWVLRTLVFVAILITIGSVIIPAIVAVSVALAWYMRTGMGPKMMGRILMFYPIVHSLIFVLSKNGIQSRTGEDYLLVVILTVFMMSNTKVLTHPTKQALLEALEVKNLILGLVIVTTIYIRGTELDPSIYLIVFILMVVASVLLNTVEFRHRIRPTETLDSVSLAFVHVHPTDPIIERLILSFAMGTMIFISMVFAKEVLTIFGSGSVSLMVICFMGAVSIFMMLMDFTGGKTKRFGVAIKELAKSTRRLIPSPTS